VCLKVSKNIFGVIFDSKLFDAQPEKTADVSRGRHLSPRKTTLSNERRNPILMTCTTQILIVLLIGIVPWGTFLSNNQKHYQDLGSARHQYGISAFVTQTSFCEGSRNVRCFLRIFDAWTILFYLISGNVSWWTELNSQRDALESARNIYLHWKVCREQV